MAKCLGRITITSVAVDCIGFVNIAAVVVVVQELELEDANSVFAPLLGEGEQVTVHPVVDCHRIDKIEYHLGVVDRN